MDEQQKEKIVRGLHVAIHACNEAIDRVNDVFVDLDGDEDLSVQDSEDHWNLHEKLLEEADKIVGLCESLLKKYTNKG
ncbi:hypothetical protein SIID45300_01769 [Candidatus Magnetaquicoccaceae bacterium FCR-1]|uniref:Uncharacterized protein n=1 Tax=Candidatus Magnetaquiglobus chichijimensis TaxID=3141448 RepID=A0ABQ0C982_9PROT